MFGANDGLVSNLSLVLGMAGAGSSNQVILLAGLAGLLAGTLSMAAGEYISVRSQRELLEAASQELDEPTLRALAEEAEELGLVFRARGMAADQAERHAAALLAGSDDQPAGEDDAGPRRRRHGRGRVSGGRGRVQLRGLRGRGRHPDPAVLCDTGTAAIVAAAIVVGVALLATGATVGVLAGGSLLRRGLRQLGIGVAAAVVTYWLGRRFGTTIG